MRYSSRIEGAPPSALTRALSLGPRDWLDVAIATVELAFARVRVSTSDRFALVRPAAAASRPTRKPDERVERVRRAIARASHRLPWRTDCLVQAIAARRWLRRLGLEASLRIAGPGKISEPFEAHAWLMYGDEAVTGGNIGDSVALFEFGPVAKGRRTVAELSSNTLVPNRRYRRE